MTYRLNIGFDERLDEPPCDLLWSHRTPEAAICECKRDYPTCRVELVGISKG